MAMEYFSLKKKTIWIVFWDFEVYGTIFPTA